MSQGDKQEVPACPIDVRDLSNLSSHLAAIAAAGDAVPGQRNYMTKREMARHAAHLQIYVDKFCIWLRAIGAMPSAAEVIRSVRKSADLAAELTEQKLDEMRAQRSNPAGTDAGATREGRQL